MALAGGQRLTAALLNNLLGVEVSDTQNAAGNQTVTASYSTSIGAGTACGITFVAPSSGRVRLDYEVQISHTATPQNSYAAPQLRSGSTIGSGTIILAASDDNAIIYSGQVAVRYSAFINLSALTPGSSYNVQLLHKTGANTATWSRKVLKATPIAA